MNHEETTKILALLSASYPEHFQKLTSVQQQTLANVWQNRLISEPYELVNTAIQHIIDTSPFMPHVSDVKNAIKLFTEEPPVSEQEMFNLILKAVRNSTYHSEEEFNKLPENIQKIVGTSYTLKEWALLPPESMHTVISSNLQRSYRANVQHEREYNAISEDIKQKLIGEGYSNISQISE
ncbi:MAG: hypothetical protein HFE49_03250 [Clostridia bacterium]|nr:hypothetical protein [Clostridia bacterium]